MRRGERTRVKGKGRHVRGRSDHLWHMPAYHNSLPPTSCTFLLLSPFHSSPAVVTYLNEARPYHLSKIPSSTSTQREQTTAWRPALSPSHTLVLRAGPLLQPPSVGHTAARHKTHRITSNLQPKISCLIMADLECACCMLHAACCILHRLREHAHDSSGLGSRAVCGAWYVVVRGTWWCVVFGANSVLCALTMYAYVGRICKCPLTPLARARRLRQARTKHAPRTHLS